ncbi:Asp-tRNA(Asn)/Glu-tRNA(Gln) amidotransferase subunit GatB [Daejeonella lutea]|uniref:Aspartyl/glutamyl-tRNA(Asn/Gln) amidotransferase subunit B n=1 Tax=Daejeonella lutea TaxID=572036 RepID=A0A1T5B4L2_9SPHI|nr:Asp-tRNA(Asn)/Glu-tRNA(Gln) amidotransferase subunit GatB [Daejeonella lutea]SKB42105.1 aspartyl/glutamyl-tRNA(Asn/Gln) amidotransferase subunit B [Daejeonella lutea]
MTVIPDSIKDKYELVVGLEVHVQLSTASKIFSTDSAGFGAGPNENISPISLGLPGTLPRLNKKVVEYAIKLGLATNCGINMHNHFDRKHYFYADLPKGFQTTQDSEPICKEGYLDIQTANQAKSRIRIHRIHMEDDAGKSMHDQDDSDSLIDLNRAGVPLLEVVSEPDIRSAAEAAAYLNEIRKLVKYLDICDGNMEEGSIRCDANISVRLKGAKEYGNRCEVKNLNSMRNLQRAIEHEFVRQVGILEAGGHVEQNTLNFDAETGTTSPLRRKEMANDYRYFPEPDLQPLVLNEEYINEIAASIPELPAQKINRYTAEFGLSEYDADSIASDKDTAAYFETFATYNTNFKSGVNWINGAVRSWLNDNGKSIADFSVKPAALSDLITLIDNGSINNSVAAQKVFPEMIANPELPAMYTAKALGVLIDTSSDELSSIIDEVLGSYPDKVKEYQNGKKGVLGLFMGDIMKKSKGKINPQVANKLVVEKLENRS